MLTRLFEGLFRFDEHLKLIPAVAREVPSMGNGGISSDGKTYTFRLHNDLQETVSAYARLFELIASGLGSPLPPVPARPEAGR